MAFLCFQYKSNKLRLRKLCGIDSRLYLCTASRVNPIVSQWRISHNLLIPLHLLVCDISLHPPFTLFPGDLCVRVLCVCVCVVLNFLELCSPVISLSPYTNSNHFFVTFSSALLSLSSHSQVDKDMFPSMDLRSTWTRNQCGRYKLQRLICAFPS